MTGPELRSVVEQALAQHKGNLRRVLLIHPDYSRNDFTHLVAPMLHELLLKRGLERLDTLNAAGTHRRMADDELRRKLGLGDVGTMHNHAFDDPAQLALAGQIPAEFVAEKTGGHLNEPMRVTVNRLLLDDYDAIVCLSGTIPHEALGYSGGTKVLFPGVSGPEVIALLHWAAVLIGIPRLIGALDNPARDVVNAGAELIFRKLAGRPVLSLNMVYTEDEQHRAVPRGLFAGWGPQGFASALRQAAALSSNLHIVCLDAPLSVAVQRIPAMYDEVWTAGKGSYKLQVPGVLAPNAEIILHAPHIHAFHSNPVMDAAIRRIGYHGRDHVVRFLADNPGFDRNVAAHVINVRGVGQLVDGQERFNFRVTLASAIPRDVCEGAGLGWRDPATLRKEDFTGPGQLWIDEGGQWLYALRRKVTSR
jgi:nickel-dependent lactate racemase